MVTSDDDGLVLSISAGVSVTEGGTIIDEDTEVPISMMYTSGVPVSVLI
jgi:hypothetical protein